ncbi:Thermophilic glucose-6-phosphate isomerase and related metalloenzymes [Gordonia paraffinivorans]|uniref:Thermophilic glucose-6-phosphate isomerase and related metalloenzymes n=1 Tax=Gordonia paraffinivorans TaxID=175628 RepID=A0ABD7V3J4_9ACTN|nr:Thermophilic glucose-6-phosphate isomerase and related metalloenzymes [Gordonia paraffinivorans]
MREPQWNVDANQLAYVVRGQVLVAMLGDVDEFSSFIVEPGQMYHVPSGAVYHIENVGDETAEIVLALRSERPHHFSLRDSMSAMTDAVLGNTYDLPASAFSAFARPPAEQIVSRRSGTTPTVTDRLPNAHLFDVEGQNAPLSYAYGSAHLARRQFWAALDDISMYSLRIADDGMREPHWHPVTAEMGIRGQRGGSDARPRPGPDVRRLRTAPGRRVFRAARLPPPHRGARRRGLPLRHLLRSAHTRRHSATARPRARSPAKSSPPRSTSRNGSCPSSRSPRSTR